MVFCSFFAGPILIQAQDCYDADFESGTLGGYDAFHGKIDLNGNVTFEFNEEDEKQHKIMTFSDGIDPLAELLCLENTSILAAGSGEGRYTMRLGDGELGARSAKIRLELDVTEEISFFLLKYAIVLNDPGHPYEIQPRFELKITDVDGNVLSCGEYKVRAEENIEGFESCGDWRVRPWTTAGFELESYLGQRIYIELITTDCGCGGHSGYAYVDASCSPLRLDLESYCPGNAYARYVATDGFESYEWNTGETSRILEIEDPIPGTEYQVTVTSSTGCTLVLKDTLPMIPSIDELIPSYFGAPDTLNVCYGEEILYQPTGVNITEVEAIELGYTAESFYLFAQETQLINFVTKDNFGCIYDTSHLMLEVDYLEYDFDVILSCGNVGNGQILIDNFGDDSIITSLDSSDFLYQYVYTDLSPGEYELEIIKGACKDSEIIFLGTSDPPVFGDLEIEPASCGLENGTVTLSSFDQGYQFSINDAPFDNKTVWENLFKYRDEEGCFLELEIEVDAFEPPELSIESIDSTYCSNDNGMIILDAAGGIPPLEYSIDGVNFQASSLFAGLAADLYSHLMVRDASSCIDSLSTTLGAVPYAYIGSINSTNISCDLDNGRIEISVIDQAVPYELFLDSEIADELSVAYLESGLYEISLIDENGCHQDTTIEIVEIPAPTFDSIAYVRQVCENDFVKIELHGKTYNNDIQYAMEDGQYDTISSFSLLPDEYQFFIQDDLACVRDTIIDIFNEDWFAIANIFTPDGDGNHDEFCYYLNDGVEGVEELIIYDRWGNNVFNLNESDYSGGHVCWDGRFKNQVVEMGVYVYYIKILLSDGRLLCKHGDVTVVLME